MDQHDTHKHILESLHAAALGKAQWEETSALIDEACGSVGNLLVLGHPRETSGILFARLCYRGQRHKRWEREYSRRFLPVDEHLTRMTRLPDSEIVHVTELFSEQERKTSPVWNEAMAVSHFQDSVQIRLDGTDEADIYWSFAEPVDAQGWSSARTDFITSLLPHVRQFLQVRHALVQAEALGLSLGGLLDNQRVGIVQVDRSSRIVAANDLAAGLLREGHGLFEAGGFLRATMARDDDHFAGLLKHAIPPFDSSAASGSMAVTRTNGQLPLAVHVSPVESPAADFRTRDVAALVIIVDPHRSACVDARVVAEMFDLTPAESEVAVLLAEGFTLETISKATGRGITTVKWHLRHLFSKLGVARQFDAARLVLALADIPSPGGTDKADRLFVGSV